MQWNSQGMGIQWEFKTQKSKFKTASQNLKVIKKLKKVIKLTDNFDF